MLGLLRHLQFKPENESIAFLDDFVFYFKDPLSLVTLMFFQFHNLLLQLNLFASVRGGCLSGLTVEQFEPGLDVT